MGLVDERFAISLIKIYYSSCFRYFIIFSYAVKHFSEKN